MKPAQLSIGDLATSDAVAFAYALDERKRNKREKRKGGRDAEAEFDFQARAYELPKYARKVKIAAYHLTPKLQRQAFWEVDGVFEQFKLVIEIQGGVWISGAHGHPVDLVRNMSKQNDLQRRGYDVLQFEPKQVFNGEAIAYTQQFLAERHGWNRG